MDKKRNEKVRKVSPELSPTSSKIGIIKFSRSYTNQYVKNVYSMKIFNHITLSLGPNYINYVSIVQLHKTYIKGKMI